MTFGGANEEVKGDGRLPTEIEEDIMDREEDPYDMDDVIIE